MQDLTMRTKSISQKMFPERQEEVEQFLLSELPEYGERIWCSVLKLSNGNFDTLLQQIQEAQFDFRDVLRAAGFADDLRAHIRWADNYLTEV